MPGLLGQLILATVATQAARNSRAALGPGMGDAVAACGGADFLEAEQAAIDAITSSVKEMDKNCLSMWVYYGGSGL